MSYPGRFRIAEELKEYVEEAVVEFLIVWPFA